MFKQSFFMALISAVVLGRAVVVRQTSFHKIANLGAEALNSVFEVMLLFIF